MQPEYLIVPEQMYNYRIINSIKIFDWLTDELCLQMKLNDKYMSMIQLL